MQLLWKSIIRLISLYGCPFGDIRTKEKGTILIHMGLSSPSTSVYNIKKESFEWAEETYLECI